MPGMSGLKLVPHLSDLAPQMGIVMITSYAAVPDAVAALRDLDALDYVQKPFSPAKLRQRIRKALRRLDRAQWLALGDLTIHVQGHVVERDGETLPLTRQEFKMLLAIARGRGRLVGYEELVGEVWGCEPQADQREFVRNAMSRLRGKLGDDAADPRYIETVRGLGYRAVGSHKYMAGQKRA